MSMPTASVLIPCYNAERFIAEAIESAPIKRYIDAGSDPLPLHLRAKTLKLSFV
jgi:hypothetical protein